MDDKEFEKVLESVKEMVQIQKGEVDPSRVFTYGPEEIRLIRTSLKLSQLAFAHLIGVSVGTLRNWEQGRRKPEGAARALLQIAARRPDVIQEVLSPPK